MAIADWLIESSDDFVSVNLEIDTPIDGTGSLRLSQEDVTDSLGLAVVHLRPVAGDPDSQFLKGKIRTLFEPIDVTDADNSIAFFGIIAMMNQNQVFNSGGKAYFAGRWGGDSPYWAISRIDDGISGTESFTHLAQGTVLNLPGIEDVIAMEFEWIYDPLEFNGVRLTLKVGTSTSFTGMTTIYQVVDTSLNSLTTTVGEGLFMAALHEVTGPVVTVLFDKTTNYELVPV